MTVMPAQPKNKWKPFTSVNDAFNRRIMTWVCKSCKTWCERNKPKICTTCGHDQFWYFASHAEATRFMELKLLERAGQITDLETQVNYPCYVNDEAGIPYLITTYRADFVYFDNVKNAKIVEDVKAKLKDEDTPYDLRKVGYKPKKRKKSAKEDKTKTAVFEIKRKLVKALYNIDILIIRR